ncbi:AAA family ATPase [Myroides odoratimimus]|uniref:AAA family ATPase n=1 Tax=Myroides odoratimimus TaxID=76832 RepID=UPI003101799C
MITKITLDDIASYKKPTTLETDKKVNLIYGLNGTGKSTFSNYLSKSTEEKYKKCSIDPIENDSEIIVYNQNFIRENFFEPEKLNGIFTLSKENKEAEIKIAQAQKRIEELTIEKELKFKELEIEVASITKKNTIAKDSVWKIKTEYSGGDRVLEFCLEGYKNSKDNLFNHILSLEKPTSKPIKDIDDLRNDLQAISGNNAQKYLSLPLIFFDSHSIESEKIFSKQIVGNKNSTVAELMDIPV